MVEVPPIQYARTSDGINIAYWTLRDGPPLVIADGLKQLLAGKDFDFTDQGDIALKGLDEPLRAWSVGWD
jgi:hypothetical protein